VKINDSTSFLRRLVEIQTFAWFFVVVGILVHGYLGRTWSEVQVLRPNDGWCKTGSEGVGIHCFGDFGLAYTVKSTESIYAEGSNLGTNSPLTLLIFRVLGELSYNFALFLYLIILALTVLLPFIANRNSRPMGFRLQVGTLFGLISAGTIGAFDRGNHILMLVPLLYGYFVAIEKTKWARATCFLIGMSLLKFWGIIFILVLIAKSKYRHAITAVASTIILTVLLIIPFKGSLVDSIWAMLRAVTDREYGNLVARYAFSVQSFTRRTVCSLSNENGCDLSGQRTNWVSSVYLSLIILFVLSVFIVQMIKRASQAPHVWMLFAASIGFLGVPEAPIYQLSLIAAPIAAVLSIENYTIGHNWKWTTTALLVTVVVSSTPLNLWSDQPNRLASESPFGGDFIFRSDQWLIPISWMVTFVIATIEMTIRGRDEKIRLVSC
jgi:hypothetical protein